MSSLTLHTSGSTSKPKQITHSWDFIRKCQAHSANVIGLTASDRVLNVFPHNVIAHYTVTAGVAEYVGADLLTMKFNPYKYADIVNEYKPTYISLVTPMLKMLQGSKAWKSLDLSSVRYMVIGSQVTPTLITNNLLDKGVQHISNWYGSTEYPPPVFTANGSSAFDLSTTNPDLDVDFRNKRCFINNEDTGDDFLIMPEGRCLIVPRELSSNNTTWKS